MSRSYKKYPYWKIEKSCKKSKMFSNSKVRSYLKNGKEIQNGKSYKKIYESWDICDCHNSISFREYSKKYGNDKYEWYKTYKMK